MRTFLIAAVLLAVLPTQGFAQPGQQWVRQFGSPAADLAWSVTTDCCGNVFVTGNVYGQLVHPVDGESDCYLAKYDPCGTLLWVRQWGTPGEDQAREVVADQFGTAWVVTDNTGGGDVEGDAFLTSFTSNGTHRGTWSVGRTRSTYRGLNLCLTHNFRILVAGTTSSKRASFIAAFDMAGRQRWRQEYNYDDEYRVGDITTDCCDNIYTVRDCGNGGSLKGSVTRLDCSGREIWTQSFGNSSVPSAVVVDGHGQIWVGGSHDTSVTETATLSKFQSDGTLISSVTASGTGLVRIEQLVPCADTVLATGPWLKAAAYDQFIARFDSGRLMWSSLTGAKTYGSSGIAMDGRGNLVICGSVNGALPGQHSHGRTDAFVIRYAGH